MTIPGRKFVFTKIDMWLQAFPKGSFHFLKRHDCERDQALSGQREFRRFACLQEFGQRHDSAFCPGPFHDPAQTGGDARSNERIAVAPEVDPRFGRSDDFIDQAFVNFEMTFAKTFFADGIARGVEKTIAMFWCSAD